jgi:hypothetical protein
MDKEQLYNDLYHFISRNNGRITSPPGHNEIWFECHLANTLPQALSHAINTGKFPGAVLSLTGTEQRIDPVGGSETHVERHCGVEYKRTTPHHGFVDYHQYRVTLQRIPVPDDAA